MAKAKKVVESNNSYDGADIVTLPFPVCIQKRAHMYIGPTDDSGVLTCIREILNNSVDEHLAGHCTHIEIVRDGATSFSIRDNGRGIPFDVVDGKNSLSRIFGTLHAGRNFTVKSVFSTGLNGVGATAVNALSASFEVTSKRGSEQGYIKFEEGYEKDLKVSPKSKTLPKPYDKSSTTVKFSLATKFFEPDLDVKDEDVERLIHETAYLNSGLSITYTYNGETKVFLYTNGVRDLLDNTLNENKLLKKSVSQLLLQTEDTSEIKAVHSIISPIEKLQLQQFNYIAIEGNIGAGKTTLSTKLSEDCNAKLVLERFADNPFLPKFYKDQSRYAFPLEMSFLADRYQQLSDDLAQFDLFKDFVVADYHIFKSLIFAKVTLQEDEFRLYKTMFDIIHKEMPKPDLYVYLYQNTERLLGNIKKRGRSYEQEIPADYLEKINQGYLDYIKTQTDLNVLIIDVSDLDFVKKQEDYVFLLNEINKKIALARG